MSLFPHRKYIALVHHESSKYELTTINVTLILSVRLHVLPFHTNKAVPTSRMKASPSFIWAQPIDTWKISPVVKLPQSCIAINA